MSKRVWLVAVIAVMGFLAWRSLRATRAPDGAAVDVAGRLWIERMPTSDRDAIDTLVLIEDEDSDVAIGIFANASAWRGAHELFFFDASAGGDQLELHFPQTGDRETARARARRCDERGMDFCLELSGSSRGVARYVSRKGWEIDAATAHDPAALEAAVSARLTRLADGAR